MKKLLTIALVAGSMLLGQVSVGIQIGPPPPPRIVKSHPHSPGPGYMWVDGYWYPVNNHYVWHQGYYTRPPYEGAVWVAPRYDGRQFFEGYWGGPRQFHHDHHWDKDKKHRDYNRYDSRDRR